MKHMFWIDLEMTGLDVKTCRIIECAAIITDLDFNPLAQYHAVVKQAPELLAAMDDWNKSTHSASGLLAQIPNGISEEQLDSDLCKLVEKFYPKDKIILCGNSIHQDKLFLDTYMPKFREKLSYRMVDVSSFKEVFRNKWRVDFPKKKSHKALDDVLESIDELKHYLSFVQIPTKDAQ